MGGSGFSGLAREEAGGWEAVEKTCAVRSVASVMLKLFATPWAIAHQAPVSMGFSRQEYWSGLPCPPPGNLPNPGIEPRFPTLQADSVPSESPRKPKNTGVGILYLLQGIFPKQESNWGLLHCRWILYQLSYQGIVHPYATIIAKYLENHP